MKNEEYKNISKFIENGDLIGLKNYVDGIMNNKNLIPARKALMKLINQDCEVEYPSYNQRVNLHEGVKKYYKGIITKTENGILVFHVNSNAFYLYNEKVLDKTLSDIIVRNDKYSDDEARDNKIVKLNGLFSQFDNMFSNQVLAYPDIANDSVDVELFTVDKSGSVVVPGYLYRITQELLGKEIEQYTNDGFTGLYVKSPLGKATIGARLRTK